jgi:hypothetical protein
VAGGWWLVAGGWWLVAGGWWLVAGGWWLVAGGWWLVAGGWWLANQLLILDFLACHLVLQSTAHLIATRRLRHSHQPLATSH